MYAGVAQGNRGIVSRCLVGCILRKEEEAVLFVLGAKMKSCDECEIRWHSTGNLDSGGPQHVFCSFLSPHE